MSELLLADAQLRASRSYLRRNSSNDRFILRLSHAMKYDHVGAFMHLHLWYKMSAC
ncbi:hypothetical protein [Aquabacterium sp.]|uniref:hypothetical protein n=1 Tax=Aquabacterium sp. TaxID=1872578 RepID=UPI0025BFD5EA|nr:hypothetical protein [Aquabacterium sp.]